MKRLEYLLATAALAWGLAVANPWGDAFTSSVTFHAMAEVASEPAWGISFIIIGIIGLLVTRCCGSKVKRRRYALMLNMAAWVTLTAFYFLGNPAGTGYLAYAALAGCAIIASIEAH